VSGKIGKPEKAPADWPTAMQPVLQRSDGVWIGWSGEASGTSDEKRRLIIDGWSRQYGYIGVDLDSETAHGFYEGIANQAVPAGCTVLGEC